MPFLAQTGYLCAATTGLINHYYSAAHIRPCADIHSQKEQKGHNNPSSEGLLYLENEAGEAATYTFIFTLVETLTQIRMNGDSSINWSFKLIKNDKKKKIKIECLV